MSATYDFEKNIYYSLLNNSKTALKKAYCEHFKVSLRTFQLRLKAGFSTEEKLWLINYGISNKIFTMDMVELTSIN